MSRTAPIFKVALDLEAERNALRAQRDTLLAAAKAMIAPAKSAQIFAERREALITAIAACEPSKSTAEGSQK